MALRIRSTPLITLRTHGVVGLVLSTASPRSPSLTHLAPDTRNASAKGAVPRRSARCNMLQNAPLLGGQLCRAACLNLVISGVWLAPPPPLHS